MILANKISLKEDSIEKEETISIRGEYAINPTGSIILYDCLCP